MSNPSSSQILHTYFSKIQGLWSPQTTEHSFRPIILSLLEDLQPTLSKKLLQQGGLVINELRPLYYERIMPDISVTQQTQGNVIGYIECKDINTNLNDTEKSEQLIKYCQSLDNLILTNHLEFRWYRQGTLQQTETLATPDTQTYTLSLHTENISRVLDLLEGFLSSEPSLISNAEDFARRLAAKARLARKNVTDIRNKDPEAFSPIIESLKRHLTPHFNPQDFPDFYVQTLCYGLFAARFYHFQAKSPLPFTEETAPYQIPESNPLLRDIYNYFAGVKADKNIRWLIKDIVRFLERTDMGALLKEFGRKTRQQNAIVHFYETFLAAYDHQLREKRGVYYTPQPVVEYIVNSVDALLRERFGIMDGLADATQIELPQQKSPPQKQRTYHRVQILDPACGTGTFLHTIIDKIHQQIITQGHGGMWSQYVKRHLLPRVVGFECMMSPYVVCHLHLHRELQQTAALKEKDEQRVKIYLTNTLENKQELLDSDFAAALVEEGKQASDIKTTAPVMVILGNPPYSAESANKGEWIKDLLHGIEQYGENKKRKTENYFAVNDKLLSDLGERNPKMLNDDYVKFIRFSEWRICDKTGEGILAFITNHAWIGNVTFRGMRESLLKDFDEIYILDLHGNTRKKERSPDGDKDENVFNIQQGVAISIFIKYKHKIQAKNYARVFHYHLWGSRENSEGGGKYGWLDQNNILTTPWTEVTPKSSEYLFIPRDESVRSEYEQGWKVTDIFPLHSVGITTARNALTIHFTTQELHQTVQEFRSLSTEEARRKFALRADTRDWRVELAQQDLRLHSEANRHSVPILYRPFDKRYTWYTGQTRGFHSMSRTNVMQHMLRGKNIGLITTRQQSRHDTDWALVGITTNIIKEGNSLFPLYHYHYKKKEKDDKENLQDKDLLQDVDPLRGVNLSKKFIKELSKKVGLTFHDPMKYTESMTTEETFSPEDVLHYIYAILHAPGYRERYRDYLKYDYPRIPLPYDKTQFLRFCTLGKRLCDVHLLEKISVPLPSFPTSGSDKVEHVRYVAAGVSTVSTEGCVWINDQQYFEGVSEHVWTYPIGSYKPAEKWLKDRKGRTLTYDDIEHYQKLCGALKETSMIVTEIDEVFKDRVMKQKL